ncbi:hypothetical protein DL98DRAFT_594892 [Cadophora sp. DSE1049]|nr:hypothetical protein DL98DRAFT_594892 [Cadophora sp. DSE1049]
MESLEPVLNDENLTLIRKWINYCLDHHPECGNRELASVFPDQAEIMLIDVEQMRLVESQTSTRYLALSYHYAQLAPTRKQTEYRHQSPEHILQERLEMDNTPMSTTPESCDPRTPTVSLKRLLIPATAREDGRIKKDFSLEHKYTS